MPAPQNFWIAQESEGQAAAPIKTIPSESKGYILGIAPLEHTFRAIHAMIHGERMQFAVRYKSQPVEVVVSFSSAMGDKELSPLLKCFDGVIGRIAELGK